MLRSILVLFAILFIIPSARSGGLEQIDQVDLIELDAKTLQLQLLVLLDDDRVNTRQAVKTLYKKINNYQDFIESGQALAAAPNASRTLRPVVVIIAPRDATSGEMQNLAGIKLAASKVKAEVEVRPHVSGIRARPIPIERAMKRGA